MYYNVEVLNHRICSFVIILLGFLMKAKQILTGHSGPVWNCKFSSNGNYCLTGGHDKTIRLWNPHKGSQVQIYKGHSYEVLDIAITTTNTNFASCGKERVVLLWDAETGKTTKRFHGHTLSVNAVAFNQSSNVLASGSEDKKVHLWDLLYVLHLISSRLFLCFEK